MAGDTLNAMTDYYYDAPVPNNSNPLLGDIVAGLLGYPCPAVAEQGVVR